MAKIGCMRPFNELSDDWALYQEQLEQFLENSTAITPIIDENFLKNDKNYIFLFDDQINEENTPKTNSGEKESEQVEPIASTSTIQISDIGEDSPSKILFEIAPVPQILPINKSKRKQSAKILTHYVTIIKPKEDKIKNKKKESNQMLGNEDKKKRRKGAEGEMEQSPENTSTKQEDRCKECGEIYYQTSESVDWIECIPCSSWLYESCTMYGNNTKRDTQPTRQRVCLGAEIITSVEYFKKKQEDEDRKGSEINKKIKQQALKINMDKFKLARKTPNTDVRKRNLSDSSEESDSSLEKEIEKNYIDEEEDLIDESIHDLDDININGNYKPDDCYKEVKDTNKDTEKESSDQLQEQGFVECCFIYNEGIKKETRKTFVCQITKIIMVLYRPSAILGCKDKTSTRHRFPNPKKDKNRYDEWIRICGNAKLVMPNPAAVY
ncbi:hypothetical protein RN001_005308 [Aquatica leii]|uniref:Uncharacterized protein n=1 Tax=Aquatica leii TaxID=1421715 RepID=A0AAN7Q099_9COLE|nr:hypothetical protein RN001_005308 [Aquatica leii]